MRTVACDKSVAFSASSEAPNSRWWSRLSELAQAVRHGCVQILGIPDYERYLAHMATHHPDEFPLSRQQFVEQAIERKYGRSGPRCC